ncbi:SPFH domain-containing protein, partial [Halapricum hydrolyticum]
MLAALVVAALLVVLSSETLGIGLAINPALIAGFLVLSIAVATVYSAVEVVEAYEKRAVTVFGEFRRLLEPGIHFIPPFVSKTYAFDMRTQTLDVPRQEAITRDNSPV